MCACMCGRACMHVGVRACMWACVRACGRVGVHVCIHVCVLHKRVINESEPRRGSSASVSSLLACHHHIE